MHHLWGMYGVLWLEPLVPGKCYGCGALHWSHQAYLPLHSVGLTPHEKAPWGHLAACCTGGCAACNAVEALQGSKLQELVLFPYRANQRLAGCAPAAAIFIAGAAGTADLHCLQHANKLCSNTGQTAPQASLQKHALSHRDDLPAPGYHAGVLHMLGPITGKTSSAHL